MMGGIPPNAAIVDQGHTHGFEDVVVRVPRRTQTRTIQGPAQIKYVEVPGEVRTRVVEVTVPGPERIVKVPVAGPDREIIQKVNVPGRVVEQIQKVHIPGKTRERVEKVNVPGPIRERIEKIPVPGPTREITKKVTLPGRVEERIETVVKPGKVNIRQVKVNVPGPVVEITKHIDVPGPVVTRTVDIPIHIDGGEVTRVQKVDVPRHVVREIFQERPVPIVNPVPTVVPGPKHTIYQMVPDEKAIREHVRLVAKLERVKWEAAQVRTRRIVKKRIQVPVDAPAPAPRAAAAAPPPQQAQWVAAAAAPPPQQEFYQSTGFLRANYGGFAAPAPVRYGSIGGYNMVQQVQQVAAAAPPPVAAAAPPPPVQQGFKWVEVEEEEWVGAQNNQPFVSSFNAQEFTQAYLASERFLPVGPDGCRLCNAGIAHTGVGGSFHGDFPVSAPGAGRACGNCQQFNEDVVLAQTQGHCPRCGAPQ